MSTATPLKMSVLREIAWREWDPIGLKDEAEWAPDEYDAYMLRVASMLRRGASLNDAVDYLVRMAREHMGLSRASVEKARNTATAIQAYVSALAPNDESAQ